jgi:hypothetical protein
MPRILGSRPASPPRGRAAALRLPGFFIQAMACLLLIIGAAIGIVMRFMTP